MRVGHPFKSRIGGRPTPGVLLTPDILKFHVPSPISYVPINPLKTVDKKTGKLPEVPKKSKQEFVSAGSYKLTNECQKQVMNFNSCTKNVGQCQYYLNFLNTQCMKN